MTYDQWFQLQGELHSNVMKKLTHKSVDEIIEYFSKNYSVKSLCEIMNVSRSGYYKWLKNKNILNQYELNRKQL